MPTQIKFTQGATTDDFGRAVVGVAGALVTCTNSLGAIVRYKLVDKHPNSTLVEGQFAQAVSGTFTPDKRGGTYQVIITDLSDVELDRRDFIIPTASGRYIPADSSTHATFNYSNQQKGWANTVADCLRRMEGITAAVMVDATKVIDAVDSANRIIFVTSSVPLTVARDVEIQIGDEDWRIFRNETTGGFDINVKINGGTPAAIPNGKSHIVFRRGTVVYHADEDVGGAQPLVTQSYLSAGVDPATTGLVRIPDGDNQGLNGTDSSGNNRQLVQIVVNEVQFGNPNSTTLLRGTNGFVSTENGIVQTGTGLVTSDSPNHAWSDSVLNSSFVDVSGLTAAREQRLDVTKERGWNVTNNSGFAATLKKTDGTGTGVTLAAGETAFVRTNAGLTDLIKGATTAPAAALAPLQTIIDDAGPLAIAPSRHQIVIIKRTTGTTTAITLPNGPTAGDRIEVKLHESSIASTVTLTPFSGTIKNAATLVFSALGTAYTLVWNSTLTDWMVV